MIKNINCILLCAGNGSRMNCEDTNKVCFPIMGKPAIVRVIESLKECGIEKFVVVVGKKAKKVMECVSDIKGVTFAFQKDQSGTGNAAMCGLKVLNDFKIDGPVLIVMGDKVIDKSVFKTLIDDFVQNEYDASLIMQPANLNPSGGKILLKDGQVAGIVENTDVLLARVYENLAKGERDLASIFEMLHISSKLKEKLLKKIEFSIPLEYQDKATIHINNQKFTPDEVLSSGYVNCATYIFKREWLNKSILELKSDNAQSEIYFTDTIAFIAMNGTVSAVPILERDLIQTFNTKEELDSINQYFKEKAHE